MPDGKDGKQMRLIDADKLKAHYAWWNDDKRELFDQIVDAQPTVEQQEMTKLLPCPFCGSDAYISELKQGKYPRYGVACNGQRMNCIASRNNVYGHRYFSAEEAAEAWNRRTNNDK